MSVNDPAGDPGGTPIENESEDTPITTDDDEEEEGDEDDLDASTE